jgi:hypothetical protein
MYMEAIREMYPRRHESMMFRMYLWNVIGYERKFRAKQARRYPLSERFI